ncbi:MULTISPECIES: heme o synthase [Halalkalicoccus]|uniref:heme o synthase n=1 Tax=Halalkalicoccus TaxID=332246 RepID=UPI002F96848B
MEPRARSRFLPLLAATTMGVYLLVIVGATTALTDAAAACPTWPACHGGVLPDGGAATLAWTHRIVALLVGLCVFATAVVGWRAETSGRIRAALALSATLYPLQIGIGAVAATTGTPATISAIHLLVGTAIFGGLLVALAWSLERRFPTRERDGDEPLTKAPTSEPDATPDAEPTTAEPQSTGIRTTLSAYFSLMKPRLMWLLCLVAAAAMALAVGPALSVGTIVATLLGGVLAIGASGTFNHVLERDVDRRMQRTSDRPLATDVVSVRNALAFGTLLGVASLATFYVLVNALAAVLGLTAIVFYSVIYTLVLKPNTVQNTVIGGAAGALPALIGWAAATGEIGLPALVLAGVIFCWTPAHFYNLALAYKEDYERGGFPMMPVVRGERTTRKHIVVYLGATLVGTSVLAAVDTLGWLFAATSVVFGGVFLWAVVRLHREQTRGAAMRSFHASNAYLGALLFAIIADALVL